MIWMKSGSELTVCPTDIVQSGIARYAEYLVVAYHAKILGSFQRV